MMRLVAAGLGVVVGLGEVLGAVPPLMGEAKWIWPAANVEGTVWFRKGFEVPEGVGAGKLLVCCDNSAVVFVNGKRVGKAEPLLALCSFDLSPHLKKGGNVVALECTNPKGPGGVIGKIFLDGKGVATDGSWKMSKTKPAGDDWMEAGFDDSGWEAAVEIGANGAAPWPYLGYAHEVPAGFPEFVVPGREGEMESLRYLYYLHYAPAQPLIPLWDEWMPQATLWPAAGAEQMRKNWARALASRPMGPDGYVFTLQHDGTGHAQGWPFPLWQQGGGIGWHFVGTGVPGYEAPLAKAEVLNVDGGSKGEVIAGKGLPVELGKAGAQAGVSGFKVEARLAPFLRLNWWAEGLDGANPYVEWTTAEKGEFGGERRIYFSPAPSDLNAGETRTMIATYKHPEWKGVITGLRFGFDNPGAAKVVIKSFHTAFDTRQTVNNLNFIRGCADYFAWTGDYAFLRSQMPRIRTAMRFMMAEFDTRKRKCVYTTWPGHEGRSGVVYVDGKKRIIAGNGIGSNYWDLMPFGGEDALATVYYYHTLLKLAELEEAVVGNPAWNVPTGADAYDAKDLREHAREVKEYGGKRFWNPATGRFGTVDLDGVLHDYGFTFLNNEAIVLGFATEEQAKSIREWIEGGRVVEGDTSSGKDIYHWRFGPRSTTKRNIDYYFWAWSGPETIPFGQQVQDGGAVLGWSYYDLMASLKVSGAEKAAGRLGEMVTWFDETQAAGGYRPYYSNPAVGASMQGGNTAGGLGLDREFFESVLPANVMLYGFLGMRVTPTGVEIRPALPAGWPSVRVTGIRYREHTLSVTATKDSVRVESDRGMEGVKVVGPEGWEVKVAGKGVEMGRR